MSQSQGSQKIIVIALVMICVILGASLVGVIVLMQPSSGDYEAQLAEKDATISSLQTQISQLRTELAQAQAGGGSGGSSSQVAALNEQLAYLNDTLTQYASQLDTLNQITALEKSQTVYSDTVIQVANTTTVVFNEPELPYAGLIVVEVSAALSNTTYAQVNFVYNDINFSYNQTIGYSGTAYFAVLPGSLEVRIGNLNPTESNSAKTTVTYIY
ncbi:MAG: hypothetical protein NWE98_07765 [Candidatus Bathyarchaeota archaeon]|nr:hypothetical protein [Candidatus Bathyarchaeota archaeon]